MCRALRGACRPDPDLCPQGAHSPAVESGCADGTEGDRRCFLGTGPSADSDAPAFPRACTSWRLFLLWFEFCFWGCISFPLFLLGPWSCGEGEPSLGKQSIGLFSDFESTWCPNPWTIRPKIRLSHVSSGQASVWLRGVVTGPVWDLHFPSSGERWQDSVLSVSPF